MIIRSRIRERGINALMIVLLFLATGIYSCSVQAQSLMPFKYMGFEGTFGVRSFRINSSIPEINRMAVVEEGGSLGLTFGNDLLRAKVRAGFYYSASGVPRTVDLFETEGLVNFYPLEYFRQNENALDIYLTAGLSMDNVKFYGHYLAGEDAKINYSTTNEPYLGKLALINATGGIGFEYQLPVKYDFVHLFAEAKVSAPLSSGTDKEPFKSTSIENFTSISVGVSFGMYR